jgi:hypothetical protein
VTKKERIAQLELQIENLELRLQMVEARPIYYYLPRRIYPSVPYWGGGIQLQNSATPIPADLQAQ